VRVVSPSPSQTQQQQFSQAQLQSRLQTTRMQNEPAEVKVAWHEVTLRGQRSPWTVVGAVCVSINQELVEAEDAMMWHLHISLILTIAFIAPFG
jgi:hypothetical protein